MVASVTKPTLLFVYGTLKTGCSNNYILTQHGATFKVRDSVRGYALWDMGAFPAAVPTVALASSIWGEIYEANSDTIESCDILEGIANGFYRRITVKTEGKHEVYMYIRELPENCKFYSRVQGGVWMQDRSHSTVNQFTNVWPHDATMQPWEGVHKTGATGTAAAEAAGWGANAIACYSPAPLPPLAPKRKSTPAGMLQWGVMSSPPTQLAKETASG